jgi:hypothetical protein
MYENVTNHERLVNLMKMFSGNLLVVKIPYCHYYCSPAIIYVKCEFHPKEFCLYYRKYVEKDGYSDLLLKIYGLVKCKLDPNINYFTVILQKQ